MKTNDRDLFLYANLDKIGKMERFFQKIYFKLLPKQLSK